MKNLQRLVVILNRKKPNMIRLNCFFQAKEGLYAEAIAAAPGTVNPSDGTILNEPVKW